VRQDHRVDVRHVVRRHDGWTLGGDGIDIAPAAFEERDVEADDEDGE
jgi:hypothetical protein